MSFFSLIVEPLSILATRIIKRLLPTTEERELEGRLDDKDEKKKITERVDEIIQDYLERK